MIEKNVHTILCLSRAEYEAVIRETKENLAFETAVTDRDTICSECRELFPWVFSDEIYGVVYVG